MTDALRSHAPDVVREIRPCAHAVPRVAIVCDFAEEGWPSMDLVGDMLAERLTDVEMRPRLRAEQLRPAMRRRFGAAMPARAGWLATSADRLVNRFVDYPRYLRARREHFDLFHVVDHSYAQLVHGLPAARTIVTCHDLDAFRCLIEPERERRGWAFRTMTRRVLDGLRRAAIVTCASAAVRDEIVAHGLVPPERLRVVHNGVHPSCSPDGEAPADAEAARLLGPRDRDGVEILHVGSTAPRKEIDTLLRILAALRPALGPRTRLVRVGGALTPAQHALARQLGIDDRVLSLPFLSRAVLAAVYRRASLVLLPSRAEGFGLPVIEALACGAPVVASDLPVLREVGDDAVTYCAVGAVAEWRDAILALLDAQRDDDTAERRRAAALRQASRFSWHSHARRMEALYAELLAC